MRLRIFRIFAVVVVAMALAGGTAWANSPTSAQGNYPERDPDPSAPAVQGRSDSLQAQAITPTATALDMAHAMAPDNSLVSGASFAVRPPGGSPTAASDTSLAGFPRDGAGYGILSTGDANSAGAPNDSGSTSGYNDGGNVRGDSDYDVTVLRVDLNVPQGADCLSFDFKFFSEEFEEYIGSSFNDGFIAELDSSTWSATGSTVSAPNNFASASGDGAPITVNNVGFAASSGTAATGTTYDGATNVLRASTPVTPGSHSLFLSVFDLGDDAYDSAAFVDQLKATSTGGSCSTGADVAEAATKYAPLVKLHSEEEWWPVSAESFVKFSKLRWSNNNCKDDTLAAPGKVSAYGLGAGSYKHKAIKRCLPRRYKSHTFDSNDHTRPYGDDRHYQLKDQDGFYLDIEDNFRAGLPPTNGEVVAPVYYETKSAYGATTPGVHEDDGFSHTVIAYWFSYGYSVPKDLNGKPIGAHEGDWEHVNVHLSVDGTRATQVDYFAHHDPANRVLYGEVEKSGTHPVVYSVKGAHGSYPTPGETESCSVLWEPGGEPVLAGCTIDRRDDLGAHWETWNWTVDATQEGWYGYGGAWGRVGTSYTDTTGPLGPSKHKDPLTPG